MSNTDVAGQNATVRINGSSLGTPLQQLLMADEIQPGIEASYSLCKLIYTYHPLGAKMAESPIRMAQSQQRDISIPSAPGIEARLRERFMGQWKADNCDKHIFNTMRTSRIYGIATMMVMSDDIKPSDPLPLDKIADIEISYNVLDPLNTAGSLVLNQMPNAVDYQKVRGVSINSVPYHRSRAVVIMNEDPLYIEYTNSGFGYVGRSVYQRALYPLKSFIQTMITDDMVSKKAGIIVAMLKGAGSIVNNMMLAFAALKRSILKEARSDNVISIGADEEIRAIDLTGVNAAMDASRKHILENIAVAADMPAKLINQETLAEGFGEGTEDAKAIARYIDRVREEMSPLYVFLDQIIQRRAWNEEFYQTVQKEFPAEYGAMPYQTALYSWINAFATVWPSLLTEPDSEKIRVDDVKLRAAIAAVETLMPLLDPANKQIVIAWICETFNDLKLMFGNRLDLDYDALGTHLAKMQKMQLDTADAATKSNKEGGGKPPPFKQKAESTADSALVNLALATARLPERPERRALSHQRQ